MEHGSRDLRQPVRFLAGDERYEPDTGVALCLSGGGYRAMRFHAGVLRRLNEMGWLPRLDRVSAVQGGSITAAALALAWEALEFDAAGYSPRRVELVEDPLAIWRARPIEGLADEGLLPNLEATP